MNSKIGVFVRSRPLLLHEARGKRCVSIDNDAVLIADKKFNFDCVFDENDNQTTIYDRCVRSLVDGCFKGFNGTVFAYGQTGSGKTYSVVGGSQEEEGIIPRAVRQIFHTLAKEKSNRISNVRVSMMEIYNDECKDLLHMDIPSRDIMIREDKDGKIFFTGAREEVVTDFQSAMYFLNHGNINRTTAETLMNQSSSRSHAIFTVSIELLEYDSSNAGASESEPSGQYIQAKLHLVDLAGSERAKRTGAQGSRLKESVGINQGLLALGKVIRALTSTPISHVPYRESKLTRFLQDSLGGNSQTVMLACISSAECNLHETLSTLQYASRAKTIHNKVVANVAEGAALMNSELESSMVAALKQQILQMQSQIERINGHQLGGGGGGLPSIPEHGHIPAASASSVSSAASASTVRILRIISQIQESLQVTLHGIDTSGATAASCGAAWQLVVVAREAVHIMQSIVSQLQQQQQQQQAQFQGSAAPLGAVAANVRLSMSLKNLRDSLSEGKGLLGAEEKLTVSALQSEVEALRQELEECREDLQRDEDIFAEKMKELKRAKKTIRELEEKNKKLLDLQAAAEGAAAAGGGGGSGSTPFTYIPLNAEEKRALALEKTPAKTRGSGVRRKDRKSGGADDEDEEDGRDELLDDLEISIAVAATEPDISQLMEDLEAMAKEKEDLAVDSRLAEEKVESMSQSVKNQKMEFVKGQVMLKQQLKALEAQIGEKERTISRLKESNDHSNDLVSQHSQRAQRLEKEQADLAAQLRALDSLRSRNIEEFEEERQLRQTYERKLQSAQEQLRLMEQQQKEERNQRLASAEDMRRSAESHLKELNDFKAEQANLQRQIQTAETAQRRKLEALQQQIDEYQQKSSASTAQIRELEQRNAELLSKLEHLSRNKQKVVASRKQEGVVSGGAHSPNPDFMKQWLTKRLNSINDAKISAGELARLEDARSALQSERAELLKELEPLRKKKHDFEEKLTKKIDSLKAKIKALKVTYFQHKAEVAGLEKVSNPSEQEQERLDELRKEMSEIEYTIGSYDEHREECVERLSQGALDGEAQLRYAELQEELETLDTELELNKASIAQERQHLNKVQQATQTTKPQYSGSGSGSNRGGGEEDNILLVVPSHPAQRSQAGNVDEYASMLLTELKSNLQYSSIFEGESSQVLDDILLQMFSSIMNEKYRVTSLDDTLRRTKQQLEDKSVEYDELVKTLQKTRNDFLRRQEQQRKETDEKVAFLLQQLRSVEARVSEHNNNNNGGHSLAASANSKTASPMKGSGRPRTADSHRSSLEDSTSASVASSSEGGRPLSDSLLWEQLKDMGGEAQELLEVAKRWQMERRKRHKLEQRNQDMAKELKLLRQAVSGLTSSSTASHSYGQSQSRDQEYLVEMSSSKHRK